MTPIIAEMSANHGGSMDKAKEMIMAAKWAGCHAVKFQLYRREDLPNTYDPKLHIEMRHLLPELITYCYANKIGMVVSVFAWWAAEYLSHFPIRAIKFASPESTRLPADTYRRMAKRLHDYNRRLWVSTGLLDWGFMHSLKPQVLFYCPPGHPAKIDEADLKMVRGFGFSDHTVGIVQTLAMVKAGATHVEKHFMLDDNCVDAAFSIYPDQMKTLCDLCS